MNDAAFARLARHGLPPVEVAEQLGDPDPADVHRCLYGAAVLPSIRKRIARRVLRAFRAVLQPGPKPPRRRGPRSDAQIVADAKRYLTSTL